jgi:hypothetical protein
VIQLLRSKSSIIFIHCVGQQLTILGENPRTRSTVLLFAKGSDVVVSVFASKTGYTEPVTAVFSIATPSEAL